MSSRLLKFLHLYLTRGKKIIHSLESQMKVCLFYQYTSWNGIQFAFLNVQRTKKKLDKSSYKKVIINPKSLNCFIKSITNPGQCALEEIFNCLLAIHPIRNLSSLIHSPHVNMDHSNMECYYIPNTQLHVRNTMAMLNKQVSTNPKRKREKSRK